MDPVSSQKRYVQAKLFPRETDREEALSAEEVEAYDRIVVCFSGGKDSTACVLHLLEMGVDRSRIELWHHDVDGRDEQGRPPDEGLMDWPCTPAYCEAFAEALDLTIYFSWKVGGFRGEMMRENERTKAIAFETPDGDVQVVGGNNGKKNTRRKFPQVSSSLSVRYCSFYTKIGVCAAALRHQPRFREGRTLVVTGERAEESAQRADYAALEPHRADLRDGVRYQRYIDQWRPVLHWPETDVWEIIQRWKVLPHPSTRLGFGRTSCMACIFGSANMFASVKALDEERFEELAALEEEFGVTMKRTQSLRELVAHGTPYDMNPEVMREALSRSFDREILVDEWRLPAGAFGESCGPT